MNVKAMGVVLAVMAAAAMPRMTMAQTDPNMGNPGAMQGNGTQIPGGNDIERAPGMTPNTNSHGNNPQTSMRDSLGAPGQNGQQILDKQFIRSAEQSSLAEVKLSTLAKEKGGPEIKDLAQKLVDDHDNLDKNLESVADAMGVMLPKKLNREQQAEYDKLNGLSGKDFDTEFLNYTLKQHWQTLHDFYMESSIAVDPGLQEAVVRVLITMHQHLRQIENAASAEGIVLPPRPPRPNATSASNAAH